MASGALPTYQKYVNGVPVPQRRTVSLRLREKYIVLLVFVTFMMVCFGAFLFLPDLGTRVNVENINIFIPKRENDQGNMAFRHHQNEVEDVHKIEDKKKLDQKVEEVKKELGPRHESLLDQIKREKEALAEKEAEEAAKVLQNLCNTYTIYFFCNFQR